jgi:hypothetical protein
MTIDNGMGPSNFRVVMGLDRRRPLFVEDGPQEEMLIHVAPVKWPFTITCLHMRLPPVASMAQLPRALVVAVWRSAARERRRGRS